MVLQQASERSRMEPMKVAERKRAIYNLLDNPDCKTVILYGEPGVGKTWTAREMTRIVKRKDLFDIFLWVYLNRYYDNDTLSHSITQQLCLLPNLGISEVEEDDEESKGSNKDEVLKPEALLKKLQKKRILLVLDDEGNKMEEQKIMGMLFNLLKLDMKTYKVLVTTRNDPTKVEITMTNDPTHMGDGRSYFEVQPMVRDESLSLLKERAFASRQVEGINILAKEFLQRTGDIPSSIVVMAKAFKYFFDNEKGGAIRVRRSLVEPSDHKIYNITDLFRSGYDLVPYSVLIDRQRDANGEKFFTDSRCINHNELIAYWIMEGYLGPVSCMETAYRKGHEILMELLDFQVLRRVEADYVTINPLGEEFDDYILRKENKYYRRGYYGTACLGLDSVFGSVDWKGLVRLSHRSSVMRTIRSGKKGEKVDALLLDGSSLKESTSKFITSLKKLQILGVFNPTVEMLSHFKNDILEKLHVFVLRSCWFMKNMDQVHKIEKFINLTILEISGFSSLTEFPDKFFVKTPKLESLNLSSLPITKLPSSAYGLVELKWLILRDCTSLDSLESLKDCKNLMVLDCSGSICLNAIRDSKFMNSKLKVINLSKTCVKILPLISNLENLTHLLLSECSTVNRLRSITNITSLEVIDLSNSRDFSEFFDQSIEKLVNLKILDLSGTMVKKIPKHVGNPRHLCFENCIQISDDGVLECLTKAKDLELFVLSNAGIQSLPSISHLTNLRKLSVTGCLDLKAAPDLNALEKIEELDLSGCKVIASIPDKSFDKMSRLQELNLSGTRIESLPSLANLFNLRRLLLKDCEELKILPSIESKSLEKLEELNISGGKSLGNIDSSFFSGTVNLHILDLSDASLDKLPSLSGLVNLHELYLRNCKGLKSVPDLESLTSLEILDLSGSAISDLPFLSNLSKLAKLSIRNCSALSLFREMGTLNALGYHVQNLPYGISNLPSLTHLDLPGVDIQADEKSDGCEWGISSLSADMAPNENRPSISISGTQFLGAFVKDPKLWESTLKKFHFSLYPIKKLEENSFVHFEGDDFVYRDVYMQSRHLGESNELQLLEVYGFTGYKGEGIDEVFSHANQFCFTDNKFQERNKGGEIVQTWSSFLAACKPDQIYELWIQNCQDIEVIFSEKESDKILGLVNSVKTLWVSNATSLKIIYSEIPKGKIPEQLVFQNLETLYLECCLMLTTIVALSHLPQKLKTLHIKFCDNLVKVFETSQGATLQCLETLHLWGLPELVTVGCQMPSLKRIKVSNCPKLQNMEEITGLAQNMENLSISNVRDLTTIGISKGLKYLSVDSCGELVKIFVSSQSPSDLYIRIRFCNKLEILFEEKTRREIKLKRLHLHGLPKLRSIGAALPNQENCFIMDCLAWKSDS